GIRDDLVTGVQTCALPISHPPRRRLHGKHPPAPRAKANSQRKSRPPVGPSHDRHRPLRQNAAGSLETRGKLEYTRNSKNLPRARSEERRVGKEHSDRRAER